MLLGSSVDNALICYCNIIDLPLCPVFRRNFRNFRRACMNAVSI